MTRLDGPRLFYAEVCDFGNSPAYVWFFGEAWGFAHLYCRINAVSDVGRERVADLKYEIDRLFARGEDRAAVGRIRAAVDAGEMFFVEGAGEGFDVVKRADRVVEFENGCFSIIGLDVPSSAFDDLRAAATFGGAFLESFAVAASRRAAAGADTIPWYAVVVPIPRRVYAKRAAVVLKYVGWRAGDVVAMVRRKIHLLVMTRSGFGRLVARVARAARFALAAAAMCCLAATTWLVFEIDARMDREAEAKAALEARVSELESYMDMFEKMKAPVVDGVKTAR